MNTASRVLNQAADLIDRDGWVQNQMGNPAVGYCAYAAISWACNGLSEPLVTALRLFRVTAKANTTVVAYNDTPGRTKEEVIQALRDAAKEAVK